MAKKTTISREKVKEAVAKQTGEKVLIKTPTVIEVPKEIMPNVGGSVVINSGQYKITSKYTMVNKTTGEVCEIKEI